ncbi:SDR family NAD(P)-dependent oxidoreductase [Salipiger mucosus]|nr:SDR family oxidoreductase [Salipiger mucosus]
MARSPNTDRPRLAIVTGASSGLGFAFAHRLAREGSDLMLVARNRERLDACAAELATTCGVTVETIAADLSQPETAALVFARLAALGRRADVLVNNAGFNLYGRFEKSDLDREIEMIRLHAIAVTQLSKLFVQARDRSRVNRMVNVASVAALVPGPYVSVHFATRAHLLSFSLALSEEFRGTDVSVTCLCPGPMRSDFFRRAGMTDVRLASGWPMKSMAPSDVATCGYDAMLRGRAMVIPGRRNRIFAVFARIAPRQLRVRFTRWIMGRT